MDGQPEMEKPHASLPVALLVCFFLAAFTQSIPMVAMGLFLNEDVKMSFEEQARFYALTFLPWSLKPLYSMVMEHFGARHRPKFVVVFSIGSGLSLLLIAWFVQTVVEMYVATMLRSLCEAIAEYGLSLALIDFVVEHKSESSDLAAFAQSRATSARMFGSLVAFFVSLFFMYGCGGNSLPAEQTPRGVIAFSSIFAFCTAASAMLLNTKSAALLAKRGNQEAEFDEIPSQQENDIQQQQPVVQRKNWRVYSGIIIFQSFFVWIGVYSLVPFPAWIAVFIVYLAGFFIGAVVTHHQQRTRSNRGGGLLLQDEESQHTSFSSGLFLFCLNACPGTSDVWFGFKMYALKNSSCSLQILLVVGEFTSFAACWLYPRLISSAFPVKQGSTPKKRAFFFVAMFTLMASAVGLCTDFVLAVRWEDFGSEQSTLDTNLAYFCLAAIVGTFFTQIQFLAEQVFVTENCVSTGDESKLGTMNKVLTPGMWYGIFLSLLEFGGSASGWIAAPIIGSLDLSYMDQLYGDLWVLVLVSLISPLVVVFLFGAYFHWSRNGKRTVAAAVVDDDDDDDRVVTL